MRTIKEIFALLAADGGWRAMNKGQRRAAVYFTVSFFFIQFAGATWLGLIAVLNVINALRLMNVRGVDKTIEE